MNVEKLKRLQAQVRIGGKGTPRRKKKVIHQTAVTDDKKLQSSLKKLSVSTIPGIEEVNIIKDDLTVIHFNNPKAQASLSANTFAVTGHGETKKVVEMLPEILPQLGQETVVQLRMFANSMSNNAQTKVAAGDNILSSVLEEEDDDMPMLVSDFDEVAKMEAGESQKPLEGTKPQDTKNIVVVKEPPQVYENQAKDAKKPKKQEKMEEKKSKDPEQKKQIEQKKSNEQKKDHKQPEQDAKKGETNNKQTVASNDNKLSNDNVGKMNKQQPNKKQNQQKQQTTTTTTNEKNKQIDHGKETPPKASVEVTNKQAMESCKQAANDIKQDTVKKDEKKSPNKTAAKDKKPQKSTKVEVKVESNLQHVEEKKAEKAIQQTEVAKRPAVKESIAVEEKKAETQILQDDKVLDQKKKEAAVKAPEEVCKLESIGKDVNKSGKKNKKEQKPAQKEQTVENIKAIPLPMKVEEITKEKTIDKVQAEVSSLQNTDEKTAITVEKHLIALPNVPQNQETITKQEEKKVENKTISEANEQNKNMQLVEVPKNSLAVTLATPKQPLSAQQLKSTPATAAAANVKLVEETKPQQLLTPHIAIPLEAPKPDIKVENQKILSETALPIAAAALPAPITSVPAPITPLPANVPAEKSKLKTVENIATASPLIEQKPAVQHKVEPKLTEKLDNKDGSQQKKPQAGKQAQQQQQQPIKKPITQQDAANKPQVPQVKMPATGSPKSEAKRPESNKPKQPSPMKTPAPTASRQASKSPAKNQPTTKTASPATPKKSPEKTTAKAASPAKANSPAKKGTSPPKAAAAKQLEQKPGIETGAIKKQGSITTKPATSQAPATAPSNTNN